MFDAVFAFLLAWWFAPLAIFAVVGAFSFGNIAKETWNHAPWFSFLIVLATLFFIKFLPYPTTADAVYQLLSYSAAYLLLGLFWSMYKWALLVKAVKDFIRENLSAARSEAESSSYYRNSKNPLARALLEHRGHWLEKFMDMEDIAEDGTVTIRVASSGNHERLGTWILFWPFSVINYMFGRLLVDLLDGIIRAFRSIFNLITKAILSDISVK